MHVLRCQLLTGLMLVLSAQPAMAAHRILLYDPDANHAALLGFASWLNNFFEAKGKDWVLEPFQSEDAFAKALTAPTSQFAIVQSGYLKRAHDVMLTPIALPAVNGKVFYQKLLFDTGTGTAGDLSGKSIAATVPDQDTSVVLETLRRAKINTKNAAVISVSKDIDALLGLSFGEADAALVTQESVEVLKKVNPGVMAGLRLVFETPKILRSPLCVVASRATTQEQQDLLSLLQEMAQHATGKEILNDMGYATWVKYEQGVHGK